jgi:aldehyde dehydrogenase (NAD+)
MATTINKIAGSKVSNCGQVCIAVDYALVHESRLEEFMSTYKEFVLKVFGDTRDSKFTGKIINAANVDRLDNMIQTSGGQVIFGGQVDPENRFVEPTLILNPDLNSRLM